MGDLRNKRGNRAFLWVPLVFLFLCGYGFWWLEQPPEVLAIDASPAEFSAARAMKWVQLLGQKPHRSGTSANDEVRAHLLQILRSHGLIVVTDEPTVVRGSTVANPRNVYARLPGGGSGTSSEKRPAFALMAHYDSVPYGPGAADNLAGVAALLETLRVVQAGPALANDLIFVFTDGEECGLLGAKAFALHAWAKEVGCLLNFEARGVCGPSYLFEFSEPKAWLVSEVARSQAPLRTSSLMFEVYRRLPFSTDFHMVRETIPGMNVAFVGRFPSYHSAKDHPANLDVRSLQHHGKYALAFARHFGNILLKPDVSQPAPVFFTLFGSRLFRYSKTANCFLSLGLIALLAVFLWHEPASRKPGRSPIIRGVQAFSSLLLVAASVAGLVLGAGWLCRGPFLLYQNQVFIISGSLLAAAATIFVYGRIRKKLLARHLTRSALLFWAGAMVLQTLLMPEGAFLWQWPLVAGLVGSLCRSSLVSLPVSLVLLAFEVPVWTGLSEALAAFILPVLAMGGVLGGGLILPFIDRSLLRLRRPICVFGAMAGSVVFLIGVFLSGPSGSCPRMSHLFFLVNADTGEGHWCSVEAEPGPWTRQMLSSAPVLLTLPEFSRTPLWQSPPLPASFPAPFAELVSSDISSASTRVLRLRLCSPVRSSRMRIRASSKAATLSGVMNGVPVEIRGPEWSVDYSILPPDPADLRVELKSNEPLTLVLTAISYALPAGVPSRPEDSIPMNNVLNRGSRCESDTTQVMKTFSF